MSTNTIESKTADEQVLESNPRGIPKVQFVENVSEFVSKSVTSVETTLSKFQETIAKYKFMEVNFLNRKKTLEMKIPEIKKSLNVVEYLITKQDSDDPIETTFELNVTLWAAARVRSTKTVYLWLGANVMLEYPLPEAKELLEGKLTTAKKTLDNVLEDLEFLREQITTMEVNTARLYNWDVKRRRFSKTNTQDV
ncbi:hypothetical protein G9A89_012846 [Geosiphon pyriformis]|nr:hypothetical protein G9A89_012846 [Geosiphon pyriformis]